MHEQENFAKIIRDFLTNRLSRQAFDAFFKLCHDFAKVYLYRVKHIGYDLRLEGRDGAKGMSERAYDIRGEFLAIKSDKPLHDGRFVRQELGKINYQENPQIQNLKRRFKNIFRDEEFCLKEGTGKGHTRIYMCQYADDLREENPPIPYDELYKYAEKAFADANTRVQWCHKIFELLNAADEYQNLIVKYELLSIVVSINARYIDLYGLRPPDMSSARDTSIRNAIDKARKKTIIWLKKEIIPDFITKKRIDKDEGERFAKAAELYLIDLGNDAWNDLIPDYFRVFMPEEKHKLYLKDYKYVFETIIMGAKEYFINILKNDSTISGFGDY